MKSAGIWFVLHLSSEEVLIETDSVCSESTESSSRKSAGCERCAVQRQDEGRGMRFVLSAPSVEMSYELCFVYSDPMEVSTRMMAGICMAVAVCDGIPCSLFCFLCL